MRIKGGFNEGNRERKSFEGKEVWKKGGSVERRGSEIRDRGRKRGKEEGAWKGEGVK